MLFEYKSEKPSGEKKQIRIGDSGAKLAAWLILVGILITLLWCGRDDLIPLIAKAYLIFDKPEYFEPANLLTVR
jgi:hypothetical protein